MKTISYTLPSPIGPLAIQSREDGTLLRLEFGERGTDPVPENCEISTQLEEYFAGKRREFDLKIELDGTPFQKEVWKKLLEIPFGETRTYAQIARQLGNPSACRAVGRANGLNKIAIVVPCHRVIGTSGKLVGFAGGLDAKELLLGIEGQKLAL